MVKVEEIRMKLEEASRLVELCLHYKTGTTCRLAALALKEVAELLEQPLEE